MRCSRCEADVQKSVDAGARVLTGGKPNPGPGNFYPPTVLTDIPKNSPAYERRAVWPGSLPFPREKCGRSSPRRQRSPLRAGCQRVDQ